MTNWSRLILPLGIAAVAMGVNAAAMHNRLATVKLIAVTSDLEPGEKFTAGDLRAVEFSYPTSHLKDHFWTWDERTILLQHVGTPVSLREGNLVPKQPFHQYGQNQFAIPEKSILVAARIPATAMNQTDRQLLIPGRSASLQFQDDARAFGPFPIAYLQRADPPKDDESRRAFYEIGVFVKSKNAEVVKKLATQPINTVIGRS